MAYVIVIVVVVVFVVVVVLIDISLILRSELLYENVNHTARKNDK